MKPPEDIPEIKGVPPFHDVACGAKERLVKKPYNTRSFNKNKAGTAVFAGGLNNTPGKYRHYRYIQQAVFLVFIKDCLNKILHRPALHRRNRQHAVGYDTDIHRR
jgi:hypothetical protein